MPGNQPFVMHALYLMRRNDDKPGIFVWVVLKFFIKPKAAIGSEFHFHVKELPAFGVLYHKIGHKPQCPAGGVVVISYFTAQERLYPHQTIVKHIVAVVHKQILHQELCQTAFEGVEVEGGGYHYNLLVYNLFLSVFLK
jgi:hypothetical protein